MVVTEATQRTGLAKWVIVQNHSYKNVFPLLGHFHANQTLFHMKGFTWRLIFKQSHMVSWKWPIIPHNGCGRWYIFTKPWKLKVNEHGIISRKYSLAADTLYILIDGPMICALISRLSGQIWAKVRDTVLCSWERHLILTVPISTKVYKWVLRNLMLVLPCERLTSHPGKQKYC